MSYGGSQDDVLPTLLQAPLRARPGKETGGDDSPLLRLTGCHCLLTRVTFMWNNLLCHGSQFHLDVLNGDEEEVFRQLSQGASAPEMFFQDTSRLSGQAIHLAAGRGHVAIVDLLLRFGACLDSHIMDGRGILYDVLHAAVHAEGFGGSEDMIDFLCESKADIMSLNHQNWMPLHVAFQTGNEVTIRAVAKHVDRVKTKLREQCPWETEGQDDQDIDFQSDQRTLTPLEIGIQWLSFWNKPLNKRMNMCRNSLPLGQEICKPLQL